MAELLDFNLGKISTKYYSGSERKIGVIYHGNLYMIKFQKKELYGNRFNHISEYIGSHIFELLGIKVHKTFLGTFRGEYVVGCKDFTENYKFVPFNDVGESSLETDKELYQYSYEDIITLLQKNSKLTSRNDVISAFFDMFIVDALIGNFDRHGGNWGFLKEGNKYFLAPVFDNGSSLFPSLQNDEDLLNIMNNEDELNERIYKFPTSQIKLNGRKSSYFEVINSLQFDECNKALERIYRRLDLKKLNELIDETPLISDVRKEFYKMIIKKRYESIIKSSYLKYLELKKNGKRI